MGYTRRTLDELNVMDDFLLSAAAADGEVGEDFCRELLTVLLQRQIGAVHVRAQRTIPALTPDLRGIRMDVEVTEDLSPEGSVMNVYDVEAHLKKDVDMPRHNRFYQARIDSRYLKSGERDFSRLPNLYVITMLNYDPFGYDRMVYHVRNRCDEVPELAYEDGVCFIYFYTGGTAGGSPAIGNMLRYCSESRQENATDEATRKIHDYVAKVKLLPEVRDAYMTLEDKIYYERKDAMTTAMRDTKLQDICELLEEYGPVPDTVKDRLAEETDMAVLKRWLKLAAKVDSLEEFAQKL